MRHVFALGAAALLLAACDPIMPMASAPYSRAPLSAEPVVPPEPTRPMPEARLPPAEPPQEALPTTAADPCGAQSLQAFVGSVAPTPFPAPGPVRVYAEGDPITMDHNASRVNVVVDGESRQRVVSISCG